MSTKPKPKSKAKTPAKHNPKVDDFFAEATAWREEFAKLRAIIHAAGPELAEELKWGHPCYTLEGGNVIIIHGFKEYCALLFIKGALMPDPDGLLIQQTENVQAARQIRFTKLAEITKLAPALKRYVQAAIGVEQSGAEVTYKKVSDYAVPEELQQKLAENPALKAAFEKLTPGRQRAYLLHFAGAKQAKTREVRVEKWTPQILAGKGMDD